MIPRREDIKQQFSSTDFSQIGSDKFILLPATNILKFHNHIDDSTALTGRVKVPVKTVSSAILKTDKHEKQLGGSSSKTLHCPSSKNILKASYYDDDKLSTQPMIFIKCITPKGPLARIIHCSTKTSKDKTNYCIHLESKLKKDNSCKIIQSIDSTKKISDKKTKVPCQRALSKQSVSRFRKSKPEVTHHSPPDCELARPDKADLKIDILFFPEMKDVLSRITHKNGLDPFELPSSVKKLSKKYKKCSASCCQSVRSISKDVCSDFFRTKALALDAKSLPIERCTMQKRLNDQRLQRLPSEQILRTEVTRIESAKSDKVPTCQKSAVAFRRACLKPKISGDTSRLPSSQELLARYGKDFIPIYQLERYEACRTKRNGLQDECVPPLLRTILEKEEQQRTLDKCSKGKQNVDQKRMSESMDPIKFLLYVE
ncbi:PREDICTED: uncharacterized protein LOC108771607 isoform X2 [Cyphomyrmex costatus]|nr:PREDICTED: uncharacterized protein LOC108771607 isoform X2 [Cyphomyrmex costatus]